MAYTTIIFDLMDVIRADSFQAWMRAHGFRREAGFYRASFDLDTGLIDMEQFIERLSQLSDESVADIKAEFANYAVYDQELIAFIRQLRPDYKLGLLSNGEGMFIRDVIREGGLGPLFHTIVISGEAGVAKPAPEIFYRILQDLDAVPSETIFIDDNEIYVQGATAVGIHSIRYTGLADLRAALAQLGVKTP